MTTYKITTTVSSSEAEREMIKKSAAMAVYKELLKYCGERDAKKTA